MNHVTELVVKEVAVKGGAKITVAKYMTPNNVLFHGLNYVGKLMRWLYEIDSNNTTAALKPRDIRKFWGVWNFHKKDLELGHKHFDGPGVIIEMTQAILLPHPEELRRYKNMKIQRVASALHQYAHVCMSRDSADGHEIYNMADYDDIVEAQNITEEMLKFVIGTGEKRSDGSFDTGNPLPPLVELGREEPSGDLDLVLFNERSSENTDSGLPDAPDRDLNGGKA